MRQWLAVVLADSRVMRQLRRGTESSLIARGVRALVPPGSRHSRPDGPGATWPLLTYEQVAPPLRGSRLGAFALVVWRRLAATLDDSVTVAAWTRGVGFLRAVGLDRVVAAASWMVAVAAVTNLVMLTAVERYHYPRQTALVVPAVVAIVALLARIRSRDIARALTDRSDRARDR